MDPEVNRNEYTKAFLAGSSNGHAIRGVLLRPPVGNGRNQYLVEKGTGLTSSPSDRGRDIECQFQLNDVDGMPCFQRWFIECKHHAKGVPPDKIQGVLSWARAERPDKVLIVVSNFLSNATKDYLETYRRNERPYFEIKTWEKPALEKLTLEKVKLRRKYKIGGDFPHLGLMHPAHILYLKNLNMNSLEYLFEILDRIDSGKRDKILGLTYLLIIRPRFREVTDRENQTLNDLMIDELSYEVFKAKCLELSDHLDNNFLTQAIVEFTSKVAFHQGDATNIEEWVATHKSLIEGFQRRIANGEKVELYESMIDTSEAKLESMRNDVKESYSLYTFFCEKVISPLMLEKIRLEGIRDV